MRYFSYLLFLVPALLFTILVLINSELLHLERIINFFWLIEFQIPFVAYFTIFFGLYVITTWGLIKFSSFFTGLKTKKDESEITNLKAKLHDNQPKLIKEIEEAFLKSLEEYKKLNKQNISVLKKENDKIVSNFKFEIDTLKEKIEKLNK